MGSPIIFIDPPVGNLVSLSGWVVGPVCQYENLGNLLTLM